MMGNPVASSRAERKDKVSGRGSPDGLVESSSSQRDLYTEDGQWATTEILTAGSRTWEVREFVPERKCAETSGPTEVKDSTAQ